MTVHEMAEASGAPRVEECIAGVMKRFPGTSKLAQARYYEEVHQELAPLAREFERENIRLREQLQEAWRSRAQPSVQGGE
jgi:hypothetical protein